MNLDFLKNIKLQPNSAVKTAIARTSSAIARNPTEADIRIFKNGSVYPSDKLVSQCGLAFTVKTAENKGNGFDVFKSTDFLNTKGSGLSVLFIALIPRTEGRIDLFASTTYEEDGSPKADVLTQGANTAGKEVLEMIKEMYGVEIPEGKDFIDLVIVTENPLNTEDGIYWIPKVVSRGEKKGQVDLCRREDTTIYPLVPLSLVNPELEDQSGAEKPAEAFPGAEEDLTESQTDLSPAVQEGEGEPNAALPPTLDELEAEHLEGDPIPKGAGMPGGADEASFLEQGEESFNLPDDEEQA